MTNEEALRMAYSKRKDSAGEERDFLNTIIQALEQTRWIPVSERLPEKSGNYWCTFGGTNLTGSDYYTTESDAKKLFDNPEEFAGWETQNVIAWMPLPQPYKGESEVSDETCD